LLFDFPQWLMVPLALALLVGYAIAGVQVAWRLIVRHRGRK